MPLPRRGDVWLADFGSPAARFGHEQAKHRPALVVSADFMNESTAGLCIVLPITSVIRRVRSHVAVLPSEGGATTQSAIQCEQIRAISVDRMEKRLGQVAPETLRQVERVLQMVLDLS